MILIKKLSIFLSLILVFTILFNFSFYDIAVAEPLTVSLGMKVLITILSSMGILTTIKNIDSVENFTDGFVRFFESHSQTSNFLANLGKLGLSNLWSGAKTKVSDIVESISTYYNEVWKAESTSFVNNQIFSNSYTGKLGSMLPEVNKSFIKKSIVVNGTGEFSNYKWIIEPTEYVRNSSGIRNLLVSANFYQYYNDTLNFSKNDIYLIYLTDLSSREWDNVINLSYDVKINSEGFLYYETYAFNTVTGTTYNNSSYTYTTNVFTEPFKKYIANEPLLEKKSITHYPDDVAVPWEKALKNIGEFVGGSIESLTGALQNVNNDNLILYLEEIGNQIRYKEATKVEVNTDTGLVTKVIEGEIGKVIEGQETQTGFLAKIWEWLKAFSLTDILLDLFSIPSDYLLDKVITYQDLINSKIPDPSFHNINILKGLEGAPIPDGFLRGRKIFDASYINNLSGTLKFWQRWFYYLIIGIFNIKSVYKLIRSDSFGQEVKKDD